ncbi:MAG: lytic transglycosylase domain-containing protein [Gammaproteobacteria bacterium]|nr:lytic transglycosylase domain-containing protein [Gammaproteobacteria bacterium]
MSINCLTTVALLLGLQFNPAVINSAAARVYVYELPDGSKLITDIRYRKKGYRLKNSYSTKPYRSGATQNAPYHATPIKSQYDALIVNLSLKYDLEPSFIKAMIHVESAFDRYAVSHAGAMGLMQLMPATAANYQLRQDQFNPQRNIEAGVQHVRDLMDRYNKDKTLSLAAYNAGEGAVSKYDGVPPYDETESYIKKVMKLYRLYSKEI